MKTLTHNVKKPFMCRPGQFQKDKQSLCIGLDMKVLLEYELIKVHLGNNKKVTYEITSKKALEIGDQFTSHKGALGVVVPMFAFKEIRKNEECPHLEKTFTMTSSDSGYLTCDSCGKDL